MRAYAETTDLQFIDLHWVLIPEWRLTNEELVDEDTKCPPVDGSTMP